MNDMVNTVLQLVKEINPFEEITAETRLIDNGVIDSLTLLALISEIERVLGKKIPEAQITPENFATVQTIVNLLPSV